MASSNFDVVGRELMTPDEVRRMDNKKGILELDETAGSIPGKEVNAADYAETIVKAIPKGVLVTTKADKVNSMIIGWGTFGVEWEVPVFVIYIREGRFTREQLDKNPELPETGASASCR